MEANILADSQKRYTDIYKKRDVLNERIAVKEKQIERLKKRASKLTENVYWTDYLITPIMDQVKKKFPQIEWDDRRLVPMGLCSRVSLFGKVNDKTISICFTPIDLDNGMLAYDTGEINKEFQQGSIGSLNGMNKVRKEITDIQQVFHHIEKQL